MCNTKSHFPRASKANKRTQKHTSQCKIRKQNKTSSREIVHIKRTELVIQKKGPRHYDEAPGFEWPRVGQSGSIL